MLLANGCLSVINLQTSITHTQKLQSCCMNDNNSIITFENSDVTLKRSLNQGETNACNWSGETDTGDNFKNLIWLLAIYECHVTDFRIKVKMGVKKKSDLTLIKTDEKVICQTAVDVCNWSLLGTRVATRIPDGDNSRITWYDRHLHIDMAVSRPSEYTSLGKYSVLLIEYNVTSVDSIARKILLDLQFPHTW